MEYWIPAGALDALGASLQSAAHDIANVNTECFRPGDVVLETGPGGQGVAVAESTPGSSEEDRRRLEEEHFDAQATIHDENVMLSDDVDISREMVVLAQDQRAFEANIRVLRAMERMSGYVLDSLA